MRPDFCRCCLGLGKFCTNLAGALSEGWLLGLSFASFFTALSALASARSSTSRLGAFMMIVPDTVRSFFCVDLLASSFAHPQTSHLPPRSSGRAGDLAMACRNDTRDATTFPTRRSPPNKRTRSLVLSHHLYLAAKVQNNVVLDTNLRSQLTLLIEARVKCF